MENALESLTGNPQALLEAVVGIDKGLARYDREGIVDYFKARPQLMVGRALDFLLAFRRIREAWDAPESAGVDRGAVLAPGGNPGPGSGQGWPNVEPASRRSAGGRVRVEDLQPTSRFERGRDRRGVQRDWARGSGFRCSTATILTAPRSSNAHQSHRLGIPGPGLPWRDARWREIAVKVQRPSALRQCLLDGSVIIVVLKAIQGSTGTATSSSLTWWRAARQVSPSPNSR